MKTLTYISLLVLVFTVATPAYAQSHRMVDRILNAIERQEGRATSTATTTTPTPQPIATSTPTSTPPAPTPTPEPEPEEDTDPLPPPIAAPATPTTPTGASADPEVLAAQNSEPTAGAGNVYRGNKLPPEVTYSLLAVSFVCGIVGMMLGNPRRAPQLLTQPTSA